MQLGFINNKPEKFIKIDIKILVIIILGCLLGLTIGLLVGKNSSNSTNTTPAIQSTLATGDSGKLSKEYKEKIVVKVIQENAKDIQKCYLKYLKLNYEITEGVIDLLFKVEENGKISEVSVTKNEFKNKELGDCVSEKMKTYYLSPPPLGINRYIAHSLAFKSEETAKKDAQERAKKSAPPKILPVN